MVGGSILAAPLATEAQTAGKIYRVGYLSVSSKMPRSEHALFEGLRELGYVEGQNLAIEYRSANDEPGRLPDLARELIRLQVDVIIANSTVAGQAAKATTAVVPIVVALSADPSWSRASPGRVAT